MRKNKKTSRSLLRQEKPEKLIRRMFGWKIAICQHPMYLLIDEDRGKPTVGERVPPWGAPNAKVYVGRVWRNLKSLDKYDDLFLNYQFSGVEMKSMAERFPEVIAELRKYYKKKRLDFIGGTYSQPHFQVLGSESNWRQFVFGKEVFQKLFGKNIKVYSRQETGLHQQLPQILRHFGYEFIVIPPFPWAVQFEAGKIELVGYFKGIDAIKGDEFLWAEALDGSKLPAYFKVKDAQEGGLQSEFVRTEIIKDLYSGPPLWTYFPDMVEIKSKTYNDMKKVFDFTLLEPALQERFQKAPPRASVRIYTYWSYIEGVWAEALSRKIKEAEEAAVLAEALAVMASIEGKGPRALENRIKKIWHLILKSQHHDVHWIEVTDLKRKALSWLDESISIANTLAVESARIILKKYKKVEMKSYFNILPRARRTLLHIEPSLAPLNKKTFQTFEDRALGFIDLPGGGYVAYPSASPEPTIKTSLNKFIETQHYKIEFSNSALIKDIVLRDNTSLLETEEYFGGELRAYIKNAWYSNCFSEQNECFEGPVAYIIRRKSYLRHIPVTETYFFFKKEPIIKVELVFEFNGDEIGLFYQDETKINVYFPTRNRQSGGDEIYYDIPFGYVEGRAQRPIFAINWLWCNGLVYVNRGTPKHWVKDGVVANVLAWGGNQFSNRMHYGWERQTKYDIRLYGKQKIEYYILPLGGKFNGVNFVNLVQDLTFPVFIAPGGRGERSYYDLPERNLILTSAFLRNKEPWLRGYELPWSKPYKFGAWKIFETPLRTL
ncbi:hypothetical protein J7M23_12295 [Candidatus Sumerlaeota bacterium]|nr:hypothetical protein [Candidatus Sumerlaeota bacterium]